MTSEKHETSDILAEMHETMSGLLAIGVIDKQTMREFDELCLTPVHDFSPDSIRKLREREHLSQAVFARHLNVTTGLVSKWERGEKRPAGPSLKLLALVEHKGIAAIM
ncbi:MAG TPA: DNA-binding transcriptional regulator [Thermomicrobiales bacterium]|nr:DNA-binding transcriptional regulator [Thermomicrobiales bacterium]